MNSKQIYWNPVLETLPPQKNQTAATQQIQKDLSMGLRTLRLPPAPV